MTRNKKLNKITKSVINDSDFDQTMKMYNQMN